MHMTMMTNSNIILSFHTYIVAPVMLIINCKVISEAGNFQLQTSLNIDSGLMDN